MATIGMLYICTGKYTVFWPEFYETFSRNFLPGCKKEYFVFTDAPSIAHEAANSLNFITEHQIDSYEGLESRLAEISAANDAAASALKDAERRLGDMALLIKNLSAYKQLRPVALELRNAKDKAAFRRQHESQLILYEAAAKALKEAGITKLPNLYALKTEYKKLDAERERLSAQYSEAKQKLKEYGIVKQNVDSILRTAPGKEHTQER